MGNSSGNRNCSIVDWPRDYRNSRTRLRRNVPCAEKKKAAQRSRGLARCETFLPCPTATTRRDPWLIYEFEIQNPLQECLPRLRRLCPGHRHLDALPASLLSKALVKSLSGKRHFFKGHPVGRTPSPSVDRTHSAPGRAQKNAHEQC